MGMKFGEGVGVKGMGGGLLVSEEKGRLVSNGEG